jgi:hypothetical protein
MNPWTALLVGILLGWLVEFVIDWLFWRRKSAKEKDVDELKVQLQAAQDQVIDLEAQLGAAQSDYANLEVETAAKVVEVEEKAEATVEANKPKYEPDDFKGSLQGRLAGLGIGAVAVGAAVAAGDETSIQEEEEPAGTEADDAEQLDDTAVVADSELPDDGPGVEEAELLEQEAAAIDDEAEEMIETDNADPLESEPSLADIDQNTAESVEADAGTESQEEGIEPPSGDPSEGGQAS